MQQRTIELCIADTLLGMLLLGRLKDPVPKAMIYSEYRGDDPFSKRDTARWIKTNPLLGSSVHVVLG